MKRYRLSAMAKADLEGIWGHIGILHDNPTAARRLVEAVYETLSRLAANPSIGRRRDDLRPCLRLFPVQNYVVVYYPIEDGIEVAGVLHGARDIEGLLERGER